MVKTKPQKLRKFKLREGVGVHYEKGRCYRSGAIIASFEDLAKKHKNKFDEVYRGEPAQRSDDDDDEEEQLLEKESWMEGDVKDVSDTFHLAKRMNLLVFKDIKAAKLSQGPKSKSFFVVRAEEPTEVLNEKLMSRFGMNKYLEKLRRQEE